MGLNEEVEEKIKHFFGIGKNKFTSFKSTPETRTQIIMCMNNAHVSNFMLRWLLAMILHPEMRMLFMSSSP